MPTHSSILAWNIPRTEEPGKLQSMGLKRVGHDGARAHSTQAQVTVIGEHSCNCPCWAERNHRRLTIPHVASGIRSRVSQIWLPDRAQPALGTRQLPGWSGIRMKSRGQKEPGFKLPPISGKFLLELQANLLAE